MSEHENEQAMCEECGKNDAVCTMALMMGSKVIHRKLCQACMAKTSMAIAAGNLGQVLGSILASVKGAGQQADAPDAPAAAESAPVPDAPAAPAAPAAAPAQGMPEVTGEPEACPGCGLQYQQLRQGGRAGCAQCWPTYQRTVEAALAKAAPAVQHTGRSPVTTQAAQRSRARREALQRRLDEAIAREDYESAAQLRDALRRADRQGDAT